jgi:fibronectin, type III domain protein
LYNKGVGNSYSAPTTLNYSKSVPAAPTHINVTPVFEGLYITFASIPEDCIGAKIYINNEEHFVADNKFSFNCSTGNYTIKICYTDVFGNGELSSPVTTSTVEEIPPDAVHITDRTVFDKGVIVAKYIGDKAVVGTKIADGAITTDKLVANAITGDKIAANAITSDKIKTGEITAEKIATGTITGNKLKANTITGDKIITGSISGDKIAANSVSGDKIQAGSIDTNKIKAGSITSDKLQVDSLSSITARIGELKTADTGARTVIKDNLIEVYDENNRLRVRIGVF